jgi:hypothetical protein
MPCLAFLRLFAVPPELALLLSRASRTADGFVLPFATKSSLASPGGELVVVTTICHEIRQSHQAVAIDHVAEDEFFCGHHTPAQYGFASLGRVMAIWRGTSVRLRRAGRMSAQVTLMPIKCGRRCFRLRRTSGKRKYELEAGLILLKE